jgi:hypothetical protein
MEEILSREGSALYAWATFAVALEEETIYDDIDRDWYTDGAGDA